MADDSKIPGPGTAMAIAAGAAAYSASQVKSPNQAALLVGLALLLAFVTVGIEVIHQTSANEDQDGWKKWTRRIVSLFALVVPVAVAVWILSTTCYPTCRSDGQQGPAATASPCVSPVDAPSPPHPPLDTTKPRP
jgi:cytochrome bd-type quinol oxidase subunit 2